MSERDITVPDGKYAGNVLVHADGGDCHGTPLRQHPNRGRYCPKCGISPDMQSTEFWPPDKVNR